jgi:hypothetical protein
MQWECGHFTPTSTAHHHNRTHSTRAPAVITTLPAHNIRPVCPFIALSAVCTLPTHLLSHSPLAANAHTHPCTHAHDQPAFLLSCIHSPSSARRTRIGDDERLKSNIHGIVFFVHKGVKYLAVAQNTEERVLVLGAMPPPPPSSCSSAFDNWSHFDVAHINSAPGSALHATHTTVSRRTLPPLC